MFLSLQSLSTLRSLFFQTRRLPRLLQTQRSAFSTEVDKTDGEKRLVEILKEKFPGLTAVDVEDISGGCGSMYDVRIEAEEFRGKRTVLQHRMVNEALKCEIENMHGLRINTSVSEGS